MRKLQFGNTDLVLSRVVYGGIVSMNEEQKDSDYYVSYAIDKGINYFDVAPGYGNAQEKLGVSLSPYRNNVYLACKTAERFADEAESQLEDSLKKLKTDYFDIYQLHGLTTFEELDNAFGENGAMSVLIKAKEQGVIRHIGFSAHNEEVALKALELYPFESVLFPVNFALMLKKDMGKRLIAMCIEKNIGIHGMKTLAYRHWNKDGESVSFPKSWYKPVDLCGNIAIPALKFTLSTGVNTLVPPGNFEHFKFVVDNIDECIDNPLTQDELILLKSKVSELEDSQFFF